MQNPECHASQQHPFHTGTAMGSNYYQVDAMIMRVINDSLSGLATFNYFRSDLDACRTQLRLRSGKLLMTYGHRRPPFGNQARLSDDGGKTWSEPMIVSGDGPGGDLGYPSTVELADGSLLSVWYELMKGSPRAVLRQAKWTFET